MTWDYGFLSNATKVWVITASFKRENVKVKGQDMLVLAAWYERNNPFWARSSEGNQILYFQVFETMTAHSSTIHISLGSLFLNHRSAPILAALWVKRILSKKTNYSYFALCGFCVSEKENSPSIRITPSYSDLYDIFLKRAFKKSILEILVI